MDQAARLVAATACVLLLCSPAVLTASSKSTESPEEIVYDADPDVADGGGATLSNRGRVTMVLGEDKKTGSATYAWRSLGHNFSLKLTAAVDDETESAQFVNFEGLDGASSLTFQYNYIRWSAIDFERILGAGISAADLLRTRTAYCALHLEALSDAVGDSGRGEVGWSLVEDMYSKLDGLQDSVVPGAGKQPVPTTADISTYFRLGPAVNQAPHISNPVFALVRKLEGSAGGEEPLLCELDALEKIRTFLKEAKSASLRGIGTNLSRGIEGLALEPELGPEMVKVLKRGGLSRADFLERRWNPFWGASATAGYKEFEFLDRDLLTATGEIKKTDDRETPWSVGVQAGWVRVSDDPEKSDEALIFSVAHERSFEAADKVENCKPVESFEAVDSLRSCESVPLGGPSGGDSLKVGLEWRKKMKRVAFAVRGYYRDIEGEGEEVGAELPLYFARDDKKEFTGGIVFGWNDDDGESLAIFVGKQFKVNPN